MYCVDNDEISLSLPQIYWSCPRCKHGSKVSTPHTRTAGCRYPLKPKTSTSTPQSIPTPLTENNPDNATPDVGTDTLQYDDDSDDELTRDIEHNIDQYQEHETQIVPYQPPDTIERHKRLDDISEQNKQLQEDLRLQPGHASELQPNFDVRQIARKLQQPYVTRVQHIQYIRGLHETCWHSPANYMRNFLRVLGIYKQEQLDLCNVVVQTFVICMAYRRGLNKSNIKSTLAIRFNQICQADIWFCWGHACLLIVDDCVRYNVS